MINIRIDDVTLNLVTIYLYALTGHEVNGYVLFDL
jgi:hypothetical protein